MSPRSCNIIYTVLWILHSSKKYQYRMLMASFHKQRDFFGFVLIMHLSLRAFFAFSLSDIPKAV